MAKEGIFRRWPNKAWRAIAAASSLCAVLAALFPYGKAEAFSYAALMGGLLQLMTLEGDIAILAFLPAVWLSLHAAGNEGARILPVVALALQARIWLLGLAAVRTKERMDLSQKIEADKPASATVFIDNDIESEVPIANLCEGHIFRVGPGQVLPADGVVTFGSGFVDENLIPGNPEDLRMKGLGSLVCAGSRSKNANLLVRASAVGENTFVSRLARQLRLPTRAFQPLFADIPSVAAAIFLAISGGAAAALTALLTCSGAAAYAVTAACDFALARAGASRRWLWTQKSLERLDRARMLVTNAPFVFTEGRPSLAAMETTKNLSENAALSLLGPIARKLETPSALALLLELRSRNIPLLIAEFFELREGGGLAVRAGEEIQWQRLKSGGATPPLGELDPFVREHEDAGDEVVLLVRQGSVEAALAFREAVSEGVPEAAIVLRELGYPVLLVSPLSKRRAARLQTELGVEHVQGESEERETETLVARLAAEDLAPIWVQTQGFRPTGASAVIARATATEGADLLLPDPSLPHIAEALAFAKQARSRRRFALGLLFSWQTGLLLAILGAQPSVARALSLGEGWPVNPFALAAVGVFPGFLAFFLAHARVNPPWQNS